MWLAVLHCPLRVADRASFHDTLNELTKHLGPNWQPPRRAIVRVHDARNRAQHGGATPDPAHLDGWVDEVDGFVGSLVFAAFGVSLDDVLLAEAVHDHELRGLIEQAELVISGGEPGHGFKLAHDAFVAARYRWRDQQGDAYGQMAPVAPFDADPLHSSPTQRSVDYGDLGVFASDLGEYHWLIATRRQIAQGVPPAIEDARRALQFAYHWILRWQQFDARYPRERWRSYFDSLEPPTSGDGKTPRIQSIEVLGERTLSGVRTNKLIVQLANIPDRARGDWGLDVNHAIELTAPRVARPASDLLTGEHLVTGQLTFFASREIAPEKLFEWLQLIVDEMTRLYRSRREHLELRQRETHDHAVLFGEVFARHGELFGAVRARHRLLPDGEVITVSVECLGGLRDLSYILPIFRSRGGHLAGASQTDGQLAFDAFALDADGLALLEEAIQASVEEVLRQRQFELQGERERQELEERLQVALERAYEEPKVAS